MIHHASKCPACGAPATDSGQPSNRIFFACESYGYIGKPALQDQTDLCETRATLREAWTIIQVLHATRLEEGEPLPRALQWLDENEHLRP
jgi:hypothetical protein